MKDDVALCVYVDHSSNVIWAATSGQINRWRKESLHVEATDMGHAAQFKISFIYNFSKVCSRGDL